MNMSERREQRLSELAHFLSGGTPRKSESKFWGGNIPWLTPKDMSDFRGLTTDTVTEMAIGKGTRLAPAESIFVAVRGMSLHQEIRIVASDSEMAFNQDIKAVVPKEEINRDFLLYAMRSRESDLLASVEAAGHGTGRLPTDRLNDLLIPRFAPDQEERIARLLSSLDSKIELNRKTNETLEAMARGIFEDWFVDFGPTKRKIEGATDPVVVMGGLVADSDKARCLADLFPASIGASGLPETWEERPIGDLAKIAGGTTPSTKELGFWNNSGHCWATPKDLSKLDDLYLFDTERKLTDLGLAKIGSGLSPRGTVLLSSRAPIGYLAVAGCPTAVNQGFIAIRPTAALPSAMALFWCKEKMDLIKANANGSTFQEISKRNFKPLPVVVASRSVTEAFTRIVDPLMALISDRTKESRALAATRDLLLPKLMSDGIDLCEAEEHLQEVA